MRRFRVHLWDERNGKARVLIWPAEDVATVQEQAENWLALHHWYHLNAIEEREMTEGLQASIDRDLLPAWRKAKDEAYLAGMQQGANLVEMMTRQPHYLEPYLEYLYCLGVGQAIANHGRDIVGAEKLAAKAQDTEGKKR